MLRPERMSRVSVTGSKGVMDDVVETTHDMRLLHVTEYDGSWEGFEPGDPQEGADEASQKLVTVRALKSTLGVTEEDAGPSNQIVTGDALEEQLEDIRQEVNELDDRRDDFEDDLRAVEEQADTMEPFVDLGIDLDLLRGYDRLAVRVGEGNPETVRGALADSGVDEYEVIAADGTVAVFAYTDEDTLQDVLVNATFTALEIPDGEGDPTEFLEELRHRKQQLESKLTTVEEDLEDARLEYGSFLLAAEEELTIEVQKREAPLTFATTENAFIAEGWIPTKEVPNFESALYDAVGDHVEIEELEEAEYDADGHVVGHEEVGEDDHAGEPTAAADGGEAVATDGGDTVSMGPSDPPVIQNNSGPVKPFETLVEVINRPKYSEFDPTFLVFLTFPLMFGFMIGDLGYGLLYMLIGGVMMARLDSEALRSLGGVAIWAGLFTAIFGILYGEIFGFHLVSDIVWGGHPPMEKGLSPATVEFAQTWLVVSLLAGLLHLTVGYVLGFIEELSHGVAAAVFEKGSWLLMLVGIWVFVFSAWLAGSKPAFLFAVFAEEGATNPATGEAIHSHEVAYSLGFAGFTEIVGIASVALFVLGFLMLTFYEPAEGVEFLNALVNVLSYTRIAAVLLAKAGMAFVVNLLVFGVWTEETGHGEAWHFGLDGMPASAGVEYHGHEVADILFGGVIHSGPAGLVAGILILVVGHLLVLVLGITSAGLQGVRLEYVEFFGKFYEGGGKPYTPFGHEREYTSD